MLPPRDSKCFDGDREWEIQLSDSSSSNQTPANLHWWRKYLLGIRINQETCWFCCWLHSPSQTYPCWHCGASAKGNLLSVTRPAMRRFWIASCFATEPKMLCSWRTKAASASWAMMALHFQHFWESLPAMCLLRVRKKKRNHSWGSG